MACGCQGKVKAWVYTDEHGEATEKRTEVEALALKIRNGGLGEVTPKK
jgi:hypothetical protein